MSHSQNSTTPKSQATDVYSLYVLIGLHFPRGPGLADTRISPFWILLDDGGGGDKWSYKTSELQSNCHQQHPTFLQARCPSCHPTNSVGALKERGLLINIFS